MFNLTLKIASHSAPLSPHPIPPSPPTHPTPPSPPPNSTLYPPPYPPNPSPPLVTYPRTPQPGDRRLCEWIRWAWFHKQRNSPSCSVSWRWPRDQLLGRVDSHLHADILPCSRPCTGFGSQGECRWFRVTGCFPSSRESSECWRDFPQSRLVEQY